MSENKKEMERDELHRAIWAIADELRGAVDGWDFKNYVLGTMFYRHISENIVKYFDSMGLKGKFATMSNDEVPRELAMRAMEEKGFYVAPEDLFCNVLDRARKDPKAAKGLSQKLAEVFRNIEKSSLKSAQENDFKGLFDDFDLESNKLGSEPKERNAKLLKLLEGIADMRLGEVESHDIDAFGDAYEYLMTMYASYAGKSGGEFFTPAEVSELLARLGTMGRKSIRDAYDPACGSGSLLLKVGEVLGMENVKGRFYGQEINVTTYNLCRINMFLHDVGLEKFDIACGNTLTKPAHGDKKPFDLIVSNPPYSIRWDGSADPELAKDERFAPAGVLAPMRKADMAFIMHSLAWLRDDGVAAIVCFPGVLYRKGAELEIRKYLVSNNHVDAVILLPKNLFFATSVQTCVIILSKDGGKRAVDAASLSSRKSAGGETGGKKAANPAKLGAGEASQGENAWRHGVLFVNAENECVKIKNNNKLTRANIERIVDICSRREDIPGIAKLATPAEVEAMEYNLSVLNYVEADDGAGETDEDELERKLSALVKRGDELRSKIEALMKELKSGRK